MLDSLRFVQSEDVEEGMKEAAEGVESRGTAVVWVKEENITIDKKAIFVMQDFDNSLYSALVGKCRIIGPQVVLAHLHNNWPLPASLQPQFNQAMRGAIVTFTQSGNRDTRERLMELVKLMGGRVKKDFTNEVTHLVAGQVGSAKYHVARRLKLPILCPQWVEQSWNGSTSLSYSATDPAVIDQYKCLPFTGCTIAVTGLDDSVRQRMRRVCEENGGHYSGALTKGVCTHLLVGRKTGDKYNFARKWEMFCVSPQWFDDSVASGYCMPEGDYSVDRLDKDGEAPCKTLDLKRRPSSAKTATPEWVKGLQEYEVPYIVEEEFLRNCKLYLSGLTDRQQEKIIRLVNLGGGTRYGVLSPAITHVILGEESSGRGKLLQTVREIENSILVVSPQWLLDCCSLGKRLSEDKYEVTVTTDRPKVSLQPEPTGKKRSGEALAANAAKRLHVAEEQIEEEEDILSQYAMAATEAMPTMSSTSSGVLDGKGVAISCQFSKKNRAFAVESVRSNGGRVVGSCEADYILMPLERAESEDKGGVSLSGRGMPVTMAWLNSCIDAGVLKDPASYFLFTPLATPICSTTLMDCVLAFTQFSDLEREHLICFSKGLGAVVQDDFARYPSHGLLATTHLLLKEPEGLKFTTACKWGIPAVADSWLFDCATSQSVAEVGPHLLKPHPSTGSSPTSSSEKCSRQTSSAAGDKTVLAEGEGKGEGGAGGMVEEEAREEVEEGEEKLPLAGVVVCCSRRLPATWTALLSEVARGLGAVLSSELVESVTHFIFKGRATEAVKDAQVRQAKERGVAVVSPYWLLQCKDKQCRLVEGDFPITFTPGMAVSIVGPMSRSMDSRKKSKTPLSPPKNISKPTHSEALSCAGEEGEMAAKSSSTTEAMKQLQQQLEELKEVPGEKQRRRSRRLQKKEVEDPPLSHHAAPRIEGHQQSPQRKRHGRHGRRGQERRGEGHGEVSNSQAAQVTYDDPEGRREKAKLFAIIKREDMMAKGVSLREGDGEDVGGKVEKTDQSRVAGLKEGLNLELPVLAEEKPSAVKLSSKQSKARPTSSALSDTSEAPPPVGVPIVTRSSTKGVDGKSLFDEHSRQSRTQKPIFLLSSLDHREKIDYGALIQELGGVYIDQDYFTTKCTHLVVGKASRTEKYLGACAAGKWVLRKTYLEASRSARRFVWEEDHEWGHGGGAASTLETAPRRWRLELSNEKTRRVQGAFSGWRVVVFADKGKLPGLKRLLEAGGASIVSSLSPAGRRGCTHAFVTMAHFPGDLSLVDLVKEGVKCLKPDYIAEYLSKGRDIPLDSYLLNEVK